MAKENGLTGGNEKTIVIKADELWIRHRVGLVMHTNDMGFFDALHDPDFTGEEKLKKDEIRVVQKGVDHKNYNTFELITDMATQNYHSLVESQEFDERRAMKATVAAIDTLVKLEAHKHLVED